MAISKKIVLIAAGVFLACLGVLLPRSLREDGERGGRRTAAHRLGVRRVIAAGAERTVIGRLSSTGQSA